jgi:hypothetical protein
MVSNIASVSFFCKSEYFFKWGLTGDLPVGPREGHHPLRIGGIQYAWIIRWSLPSARIRATRCRMMTAEAGPTKRR